MERQGKEFSSSCILRFYEQARIISDLWSGSHSIYTHVLWVWEVCVCVYTCTHPCLHIIIAVGIRKWSWVFCEQWMVPSFREVHDLPSITQKMGVEAGVELPWPSGSEGPHTSEEHQMYVTRGMHLRTDECVCVCMCVCVHTHTCALVKSPPSRRPLTEGAWAHPASHVQLSEAPSQACWQCSQVLSPVGWTVRNKGG